MMLVQNKKGQQAIKFYKYIYLKYDLKILYQKYTAAYKIVDYTKFRSHANLDIIFRRFL